MRKCPSPKIWKPCAAMDLERMRMDKKFDFTVEVDPALDPEEVMVPPLVVQPFVENAIGMAWRARRDRAISA
ncbi:MAG: hypothetical protein IPG10_20730 [Flavobacteriales bacterium]|nr:hypothetical protein [Flavobacteriales bacterium]